MRDEVKLLDFGIAAREDQHSDPAGTVSYMAPELLFGTPASAASDLYSVGVMFWQMLTGVMPYGPTRSSQIVLTSAGTPSEQTLPAQVVQVLKDKTSGARSSGRQPLHHQETDTTDPVTFAKQLAQASISSEQKLELAMSLLGDAQQSIGPILRRLLKRKREQRYQQASEVLHDLRTAIGESVAVETVATRESFLQAAELVGRETELMLLGQALSDAQEGRGSGFMIGGESGVGKSRLLHEIATQALVQGALLLRGHAAIEGRTLYHEWRPIVRTLCLHVEVRDDEAAILQWVVPDLRHVLQRPVPPASKAVRAQAGEALKQVLESLVRRLGRPLVLILEDLQWFGSESLALLDHLSRCAAKLPLLLLSSYRHDESPQLAERLPALSLLRLERLTADHVARLCDLMLGPTAASNGLTDYLYRETEGNSDIIWLLRRSDCRGRPNGLLRLRVGDSLEDGVRTSALIVRVGTHEGLAADGFADSLRLHPSAPQPASRPSPAGGPRCPAPAAGPYFRPRIATGCPTSGMNVYSASA